MGRQGKVRDDETWEMIRREWEAGETGASLAKRYDVTLANLWRRRAAEAWERRREADPRPEPVEGWERYARLTFEAFEVRRGEARMVADILAQAMWGGPLEAVPLWDVGYVLRWRAEHLGPETARRDREWVATRGGWTARMWDEDGRLLPLVSLDRVILDAQRALWRAEAGLPDGAAESWP